MTINFTKTYSSKRIKCKGEKNHEQKKRNLPNIPDTTTFTTLTTLKASIASTN